MTDSCILMRISHVSEHAACNKEASLQSGFIQHKDASSAKLAVMLCNTKHAVNKQAALAAISGQHKHKHRHHILPRFVLERIYISIQTYTMLRTVSIVQRPYQQTYTMADNVHTT